MTYPILTADQFIAQGTSAGAVLSIAKFLRSDKGGHTPNPDAARVRAVGYEVARLTGMDLGGRRNKKPANDNRRRAKARAA